MGRARRGAGARGKPTLPTPRASPSSSLRAHFPILPFSAFPPFSLISPDWSISLLPPCVEPVVVVYVCKCLLSFLTRILTDTPYLVIGKSGQSAPLVFPYGSMVCLPPRFPVSRAFAAPQHGFSLTAQALTWALTHFTFCAMLRESPTLYRPVPRFERHRESLPLGANRT